MVAEKTFTPLNALDSVKETRPTELLECPEGRPMGKLLI
jgi:hypothetical protein